MATEFDFEQVKRLVIHNYTQYGSLYELIMSEFVGLEGVKDEDDNEIQGVLKWANGVAMLPSATPYANDLMAKEMMEGNLHWAYLAFAPMDDYQKAITTDAGRFLVLDGSKNDLFADLASELKSRFLKKE